MPDEIVEETMIEENNKYLNKNILNIDEVHLDNFINQKVQEVIVKNEQHVIYSKKLQLLLWLLSRGQYFI